MERPMIEEFMKIERDHPRISAAFWLLVSLTMLASIVNNALEIFGW